MTIQTSDPAPGAGEGTINADANPAPAADAAGITAQPEIAQAEKVEPTLGQRIAAGEKPGLTAAAAKLAATPGAITAETEKPVIPGAPPPYTPNYKYKAALQEKELDEFWRPLIKDAESEKKVKQIFSKVDAFDFVTEKKESLEKNYNSLLGDFEAQNDTVTRFNKAVESEDLSSAFRLARITREQVFKWAQNQIAIMELPEEQRRQYEQAESAREQKYGLEQQVSSLQKQYEGQAVQNRTIQLDMALARPQVAQFAEKWDEMQSQPGAFREFVISEAKRVYHESNQDIAPEQAVNLVMQRFGKFLNVGTPTAPAPQAPTVQTIPQSQKPVIPNVTGKAASPVKKGYTLDEIKKLAKSL